MWQVTTNKGDLHYLTASQLVNVDRAMVDELHIELRHADHAACPECGTVA